MFVGGSGSRSDASLLQVGWGVRTFTSSFRRVCDDDVRSFDTSYPYWWTACGSLRSIVRGTRCLS